MAASQFAKSYHSFSGVDIKAVFGNKPIGELQAISYSITREKAPLYTMGSADPRSFSRGKRGIAGTLIFIMFDRPALLNAFGMGAGSDAMMFLSDTDDFMPKAAVDGGVVGGDASIGQVSGADIDWTNASGESPINSVEDDQQPMAPWFADQIPPFDITLAAANEYGSLAVMRIYGVEILNEGYGVSIDDIVSEQQMTYVARTLAAWTKVTLSGDKQKQLGIATDSSK